MGGVLFEKFPKMYRLNGPVVVSEKIDGTNGCIIITEDNEIYAQSRTRLITPENDNFGFAKWVYENKNPLIEILGIGRHYGEWWGKGIQRGYGLNQKWFSLFNTTKWDHLTLLESTPLRLDVVPELFTGTMPEVIQMIPELMLNLKTFGSQASPGYMSPEGIAIYDTNSGVGYKKTFDYDDTGKGGNRDVDGNII